MRAGMGYKNIWLWRFDFHQNNRRVDKVGRREGLKVPVAKIANL
jgi:hypothetical protein